MQIKKRYFVGILLVGMLIGWFTLGGTAYVMEKTSSTEFCLSCHTMEQPFKEYQGSVHFSNAKGIRAECSDCHIPKEPVDFIVTKIRASKDIYHEFITGKIDSEEKYEEHRAAMAETVWAQMKENDSATCRSCHTHEAMEPFEQSEEARKMHQFAVENDQTCIDCHKGVAHFLPEVKLSDDSLDALIKVADNTKQDADIVYPIETISMGDLGTINPATKLTVKNADEKTRTVELNAYQMKGAEQVLYVAEGKRSIIATLTEKGQKALVVGDYKTDAYGNEWRAASLTAQISSHVLDNLQPLWDYAEELDTVYCSTCHAKIAPEHFTVNAWGPVAKGMGARTDITDENLEILTKFFQSNAKDMVEH